MSVKNIIRSLKFFSILNDEQVELLSSIATLQNYTEDYVLHYENKESNKLLFLTEGLAKAYKIDKHDNEIFLYYIHRNSLISEVSNIDSEILSSFSNIVLIEDSQVLCIDYRRFKTSFLESSKYFAKLLSTFL